MPVNFNIGFDKARELSIDSGEFVYTCHSILVYFDVDMVMHRQLIICCIPVSRASGAPILAPKSLFLNRLVKKCFLGIPGLLRQHFDLNGNLHIRLTPVPFWVPFCRFWTWLHQLAWSGPRIDRKRNLFVSHARHRETWLPSRGAPERLRNVACGIPNVNLLPWRTRSP